jgi:hypothetical protein
MRKRIALLLLCLVPLVLFGGRTYSANFLAAAVDCGTSTTLVNGTGFNSVPISIPRDKDLVLMTVTFTRTTGSTAKVYFEFQGSNDGGTTWTTAYLQRIEVATNETAVSSVVRYAEWVPAVGVSHFRLSKVQNLDAGVALTACNVTLSF